jgi:hypothetical protein
MFFKSKGERFMKKNNEAGFHYDLFIPEHLLVKLLPLAEAQGVSSKEYLMAMIDAMIQMEWELRN